MYILMWGTHTCLGVQACICMLRWGTQLCLGVHACMYVLRWGKQVCLGVHACKCVLRWGKQVYLGVHTQVHSFAWSQVCQVSFLTCFHIEAVSLTRLVYLPSQLVPVDPLPLPSKCWWFVWATMSISIYLGTGNANSSPSICTKTLYLWNHVPSPVCFSTRNWGDRFHKALSLTQGIRWEGRGSRCER